jgi:hypothetical protein
MGRSSLIRLGGPRGLARLLARVLAGVLLVAVCVMGVAGSAEAPAAKAGSVHRPPVNVILFGWDGAQRAHVKGCLSRGELPTLRAVAEKGRLVAIDVVRTTDTKAGWSQILTGYQPEKSGVFSNARFQPIPEGYTIFERLEQRYGAQFVTVAVVGKKAHVDYDTGKPYANAMPHMDVFDNGLVENQLVAQRAMDYLEQYKSRPFFFFVHFAQPDHAGHAYGENSQQYTDGIVSDDYWTGQILAKLRALGLSRSTEVYITADHGFDEGLKSHGDAPYVFLATTDSGVMRRGLREDIAPTIYDRLGIARHALSPALDGHSLRRAYSPPLW